MDLWKHFDGQRYEVLGLSITDPDTIKQTKNVIISCILLTLVFVFTAIVEVANGATITSSVFGFFSSASAPAFGYLGARRGSATFMSMFIALMILNAGLAFTLVVTILSIRQAVRNLVWAYFALWLVAGLLSIWAAFNANKLFAKLLQGEQIIESNQAADGALPQIDTQLPVFEEVGRKRIFSDISDTELGMVRPTPAATTKE